MTDNKLLQDQIMRMKRELNEAHRQIAFWRHAYNDELKAVKMLQEQSEKERAK